MGYLHSKLRTKINNDSRETLRPSLKCLYQSIYQIKFEKSRHGHRIYQPYELWSCYRPQITIEKSVLKSHRFPSAFLK